MLPHRPHWVVPSHQQVVVLGAGHLFAEPGQLATGHSDIPRLQGLLILEVIWIATDGHGVYHEDGHGSIGPRYLEPQPVVVFGEMPADIGGRLIRDSKKSTKSILESQDIGKDLGGYLVNPMLSAGNCYGILDRWPSSICLKAACEPTAVWDRLFQCQTALKFGKFALMLSPFLLSVVSTQWFYSYLQELERTRLQIPSSDTPRHSDISPLSLLQGTWFPDPLILLLSS